MYSGQHALDETNSSDEDQKKNPAIRKLVYSQYRYPSLTYLLDIGWDSGSCPGIQDDSFPSIKDIRIIVVLLRD